MACDRMPEFLSLCGKHKHHRSAKPNAESNSNSNSSSMNLPINDETKYIFSTLNDIRQLMTTLTLLHKTRLLDSSNEKREVVHNTMEEIRLMCHSCREMIINYDHHTQEKEEELAKGIPSMNTAEIRMRYNIAAFMEYQLMAEVRSVWMEQKKHEEKLIEATARRIKARFLLTQSSKSSDNNNNNNRATDDSFVLEESELREIAQQILATGNEGRLFFLARDELERVMRTRDAVLELEREMQDLLNLFSDLFFLVNEQHDRLLKVQENVQKSNENLERGMRQLTEAKHHEKSCCNVI
ncbi:uncharacterized protein TM35_000044570 [Trypanosoma theileri]|uniref:t-SNARE coiled-coil homology domain-containing protein n=1 Tax=Trypanosoma theileri TaxID=67003 RepID=A0A1X0P6I0_9TRYP|nr:uncharacterized protein TM35_000044570 [Trypanosoma theileri]ORC92243.1 hypothetical protein TM35_000044570 [Trypanosoma theileri]